MTSHRLDPLLRPRSIAVVGASTRAHSAGNRVVAQLLAGGYRGALYPVNPRYEEVEGVPCHGALDALPGPAELAILALASPRIERQLDLAIEQGIPALIIFPSLHLEDDSEPRLMARVRAKAREAGLLLCGGNSMGYHNFSDGVRAGGYDTRPTHRAGNVALISHSGSVFAVMGDSDERIDYSLMVSTGQELVTTVADYLDFALDMPETEVVGLFIETVRDPQRFIAGLEKANARAIPVVAVKVGRSEAGARMAESHSGAMAGDDAAYQALFERYGVARVDSIDQLATALIMFAQPHPVGPGGLATIHDSGGERALIVDLAEDRGVPFAELAPDTLATLAANLGPGLPAINPLDAWDIPEGYDNTIKTCLGAMMTDPATSIGAMIGDRSVGGAIWTDYRDFLNTAHAASGKPTFLVSNHQGTGADPLAVELTREGIPVLDGIAAFLAGTRALFDWRDHQARPAMAPSAAPDCGPWRHRLTGAATLDIEAATALLDDFAIPAVPVAIARDREAALAAAESFGYPVALKTAEPAIAHKTDVGGVKLGLGDATAIARAYDDLAGRLGERVAVSPMAGAGVEMILGLVRDAQFGPLVMIGSGGVHAETLGDAVFALPPFDADCAHRLVDRLALRPLLDGARGARPADIDGLCQAAARFSVLAATLGDVIAEIDINPLIVGPGGCIAVDVLVIADHGGG